MVMKIAGTLRRFLDLYGMCPALGSMHSLEMGMHSQLLKGLSKRKRLHCRICQRKQKENSPLYLSAVMITKQLQQATISKIISGLQFLMLM